MNEYSVIKKGQEYGLWARTAHCFVIFGTKRKLSAIARELNKEGKK